jgi:GNAT superfamily N-acetyltransferase
MSSSPRLEVHRTILSLHAVRSAGELRAALAFAQCILGLADDHRGGFFDYYLSRYLRHTEHGQLQFVAEAEGEIHGTVLGSIQGNHILIGEVAIDLAYRGYGIGSRLLALVEHHARLFGYHRFLLGSAPDAQGFYLKNGYTPLLWLHVENSGRSQLEQVLQAELRAYPLIWKPAVWKQADRQGIQLALQTPAPDEALRKRIEQAVPTCQGDYLFAKGYEVVTDGFVSTGEISEIP